MINMSVAEWAAVPDNPRQRNTESHANKASRDWLKTAHISHAVVHAARLQTDGKLVKLDGHTRSLLWSQGRLDAPEFVHVVVHSVANWDAAKELYTTFDSAKTVEGAKDKLYGAHRDSQTGATSGLVLNGPIVSALRVLSSGNTDIYKTLPRWKNQLRALDDFGFGKNRFSAGAVAGLLALLYRRGERILPFIHAAAADGGMRNEEGSDGVDHFCRMQTHKRGGGAAEIKHACALTIACGELWISGKFAKRPPAPVDIDKYLQADS